MSDPDDEAPKGRLTLATAAAVVAAGALGSLIPLRRRTVRAADRSMKDERNDDLTLSCLGVV